MTAECEAGNNHAFDPDHGEAFAITVTFELEEGMFRKFHQLVSENATLSVAREPGCLRFDVLTPLDVARPQVFLYEIYTDHAAFAQHLETEHYLQFDQNTRGMVRNKTVANFRVMENVKERLPE